MSGLQWPKASSNATRVKPPTACGVRGAPHTNVTNLNGTTAALGPTRLPAPCALDVHRPSGADPCPYAIAGGEGGLPPDSPHNEEGSPTGLFQAHAGYQKAEHLAPLQW